MNKTKGCLIANFATVPLIAIAGEVHWTLEEVEHYFVDYDLASSDDDHDYYLATFNDETPDELKQIAGLNSSNQLHLDLNCVFRRFRTPVLV
ncbi:hypothetical protein [Providencia stuartii]|uniref:hypothetical protein n=1 Tax=Providencia stuartii TaxID=588 RepID=UPI0034E5567D